MSSFTWNQSGSKQKVSMLKKWKQSVQHIDRLKPDTIDGGGRKCGSGEKLATAWGERKRRAARCDKAAGWRRGAGRGKARGGTWGRGAGCARNGSPLAAPFASRQSPADSACACVTRAAPCTALVPRSRRVPPRCGRERELYATGETFLLT